MRLCRRQMGPRRLGVALQEIALRQANLATRGVKDGSGFVPPPYAVSQEIQPAVKIAELVNHPAFVCLTDSQPLGQPVLAGDLYRFGCEASRCRRIVPQLRSVRSCAERPGKAGCVILVARMSYARVNEPHPGFGEAHQGFYLPAIGSANHAWMRAVNREFALRNCVGERRPPSKKFGSLSELACNK